MSHFLGQRLSYNGELCTVRWIGQLTDEKVYVGVEWDDPSRGKHDGQFKGTRIFSCRNPNSKKAASFLPASRKADPPISFLEAVRQKYATEDVDRRDILSQALDTEIEISGKVVYEVGFDKIRSLMKQLDQLKHVVLDGMWIDRASDDAHGRIGDVCPMIQTLVMRRNLFDTQDEIMKICRKLTRLTSLDISGNRFAQRPYDGENSHRNEETRQAFSKIIDLSLDETMLSWADLSLHTSFYTKLSTLSASGNAYTNTNLSRVLSDENNTRTWTTLKLENNLFTSLDDLAGLASLQHLKSLYLKGNQISKSRQKQTPNLTLSSTFVDLSYNAIDSWQFIDTLQNIFPNLTSLRIDHNPFYSLDPNDAYLLVIARLPKLTTLNYRTISPVDRTDAEMFYLSTITKQLSLVSKGQENLVFGQHPRYRELSELYGEAKPTNVQETVNPNFLEARLTHFTFILRIVQEDGTIKEETRIKRIPKTLNIYQLKGVVRRLFEIDRKFDFRLVLRGEDEDVSAPSIGNRDVERLGVDEEFGSDSSSDEEEEKAKDVELVESTRSIDSLVGLAKATVRIEIR